MEAKELSVEVSKFYKFKRTDAHNFKVIAIHKEENYACIVYDNETNEKVELGYLNHALIKGVISEIE